MIKTTVIAIATGVALLLAACDSAVLIGEGSTATNQTPTPDIDNPDSEIPDTTPDAVLDLIATAEAAGNFTTLLAAIDAADLRSTLADATNINTVFAPTDSAFEAIGTDTLNELLGDSDRLRNVLLYHVLAGSNNGASLTDQAGSTVTMLNGSEAAITFTTDQLRINTASITAADIAASNGIIHVIDTVLIPPATNDEAAAPTDTIAQLLSNDPQFSTLVSALTATGLDATLAETGNFTVFAPSNDAFDVLGDEVLNALLASPDQLRDILLLHVIEGNALDSIAVMSNAGKTLTSAAGQPLAVSVDDDSLNINNATIISADLTTSNGVVHVIDSVLTPLTSPDSDSIVGVLSANPDYSTLVSLITQAGLTDILNDNTASFTLFAPNNDAIAAAETQLATGFSNDTAALGNLLLGHVTGTRLTSAEVIALDGTELEMVTGSQPVVLTRDTLSIGGAIIIDPDMQSSNGIIHGISSVLIP